MFEAAEVTAAAIEARVAAIAIVHAANVRVSADSMDACIHPDSAHAARCSRSAHDAAVDGLVRSFRVDGACVKKEQRNSDADKRRFDGTRTRKWEPMGSK